MAVGATDVDLLQVRRPGDGGASDWRRFVGALVESGRNWFRLDAHERLSLLVHDVPDLDVLVGGCGDELVLEVESQGVDFGLGLVLDVRLAEVVVVPDLDAVVFAAGADVLAVEGKSESVDVVLVGLDGGDAGLGVVPQLELSVSSDGGVVLVLLGVGVSDLGDPVSVVVALRGVLDVSLDVPELHGVFVASREDSAGVGGEADRLDFLLVVDELDGALGESEVPESEGLVPRGGDGVLVVAGDVEVGDEVVVTGEASEGSAVLAFLGLLVQVPDDQRLVARAGNEHGVFEFSRLLVADDGCDGSRVSEEETCKFDLNIGIAFHFNWRIY